MNVEKIMSRNVELIHQNKSLREAGRKMRASKCGSLVVENDKKIVGIITDRDIAIGPVAEGRNMNAEKVRNHMSKQLKYCYTDDTVEQASRLMKQNRARRLAVLNKENKLVGVISVTDFSRHQNSENLVSQTINQVSA